MQQRGILSFTEHKHGRCFMESAPLYRPHAELGKPVADPAMWTGQHPRYASPVLSFLEGHLCISCGPKHIEKGHLLTDTPNITPEQVEAIDVWEPICEVLHAETAFEEGDIQLLNRAVTMHTRTAYEDWPETARRRNLWRIWLSLSDVRPRAPYCENWK